MWREDKYKMEKKIQKEPYLRGSFILFIIHVFVALIRSGKTVGFALNQWFLFICLLIFGCSPKADKNKWKQAKSGTEDRPHSFKNGQTNNEKMFHFAVLEKI